MNTQWVYWACVGVNTLACGALLIQLLFMRFSRTCSFFYLRFFYYLTITFFFHEFYEDVLSWMERPDWTSLLRHLTNLIIGVLITSLLFSRLLREKKRHT